MVNHLKRSIEKSGRSSKTLMLLFCTLGVLLFVPNIVSAAEGGSTPPIDTGTTAWMLISTGLVLLMVPGLAMFYGGLVRTKNVIGTMMHSFAAMAIIGVIWAIFGYAMAFGPGEGGLLWRAGNDAMLEVRREIVALRPDLSNAVTY